MTTLPARVSAPASFSAFSAPDHDTASTTTSANFAASAKVPTDATDPAPASLAHASAFSLAASREPIITWWPVARNAFARVLPTSPVPSMPIFIRLLLCRQRRSHHQPRHHRPQHVFHAIREDELHLLADFVRQIAQIFLIAAR